MTDVYSDITYMYLTFRLQPVLMQIQSLILLELGASD